MQTRSKSTKAMPRFQSQSSSRTPEKKSTFQTPLRSKMKQQQLVSNQSTIEDVNMNQAYDTDTELQVSDSIQNSQQRTGRPRGRPPGTKRKEQQVVSEEVLQKWQDKLKEQKHAKKRQRRFEESKFKEPVIANESFKSVQNTPPNNKSPVAQESNSKKKMQYGGQIMTRDKLGRNSKQVFTITHMEQERKNIWLSDKDLESINQRKGLTSPSKSLIGYSTQEKIQKQREEEEVRALTEKIRKKELIQTQIDQIQKELMESDNEQAYPTLNKKPGSPFSNIPKKILAMSMDQVTEDIYYLCSWTQDYQECFYTPSLVPSIILKALDQEQLILKFMQNSVKLHSLKVVYSQIDI